MGKGRESRPARTMKPVFLVFCEGETEENYIDFIRREYRSPIKIIAKTEGNRISHDLIAKRQQELKMSKNEKITTFLMYDLDVLTVNDKLRQCDAQWLCSNPCIELWFLLHGKEQNAEITTSLCNSSLKKINTVWHDYRKPLLTDGQRKFLKSNVDAAIARARKLSDEKNPSSGVYKLVEAVRSAIAHSK